jgi:hypothetical protein
MRLDDVEAGVRNWFVQGEKLIVYTKGKYDCKLGTRPREEQGNPGSIVIDIRMQTLRSLRRVDSISVFYRCRNWGEAYIFAAAWKGHDLRLYHVSSKLWEVRVFVTADQFDQRREPMPFPMF